MFSRNNTYESRQSEWKNNNSGNNNNTKGSSHNNNNITISTSSSMNLLKRNSQPTLMIPLNQRSSQQSFPTTQPLLTSGSSSSQHCSSQSMASNQQQGFSFLDKCSTRITSNPNSNLTNGSTHTHGSGTIFSTINTNASATQRQHADQNARIIFDQRERLPTQQSISLSNNLNNNHHNNSHHNMSTDQNISSRLQTQTSSSTSALYMPLIDTSKTSSSNQYSNSNHSSNMGMMTINPSNQTTQSTLFKSHDRQQSTSLFDVPSFILQNTTTGATPKTATSQNFYAQGEDSRKRSQGSLLQNAFSSKNERRGFGRSLHEAAEGQNNTSQQQFKSERVQTTANYSSVLSNTPKKGTVPGYPSSSRIDQMWLEAQEENSTRPLNMQITQKRNPTDSNHNTLNDSIISNVTALRSEDEWRSLWQKPSGGSSNFTSSLMDWEGMGDRKSSNRGNYMSNHHNSSVTDQQSSNNFSPSKLLRQEKQKRIDGIRRDLGVSKQIKQSESSLSSTSSFWNGKSQQSQQQQQQKDKQITTRSSQFSVEDSTPNQAAFLDNQNQSHSLLLQEDERGQYKQGQRVSQQNQKQEEQQDKSQVQQKQRYFSGDSCLSNVSILPDDQSQKSSQQLTEVKKHLEFNAQDQQDNQLHNNTNQMSHPSQSNQLFSLMNTQNASLSCTLGVSGKTSSALTAETRQTTTGIVELESSRKNDDSAAFMESFENDQPVLDEQEHAILNDDNEDDNIDQVELQSVPENEGKYYQRDAVEKQSAVVVDEYQEQYEQEQGENDVNNHFNEDNSEGNNMSEPDFARIKLDSELSLKQVKVLAGLCQICDSTDLDPEQQIIPNFNTKTLEFGEERNIFIRQKGCILQFQLISKWKGGQYYFGVYETRYLKEIEGLRDVIDGIILKNRK